jgi:putative peptide zinc metalloprotease protein
VARRGSARADIWAALSDRLDHGLSRPALADGIEVVRFATRWGGGYTMVKNPRGPSYFRFGPDEGELLQRFDGTRTVREIVVDRLQESAALDLDDVAGLVAVLEEGDLLSQRWIDVYAAAADRLVPPPARLSRRIRHALRAQTVQISSVHRWVDLLYRAGGRWLFTPVAQVLLILVLVVGGALFVADVHGKHYAISSKALATSFGLLFVFDLLATLIHELGHALAIRHAGRRVLSAGFQLYLGHPAFFIDSADIMLASPRQRVVQAWFGPYSGFVIAGLCGLLVWVLPHGGLAQVLFNLAVLTYVTAAMNLIPFLELDGYWMLLDLLQTTDLRPRSLSFIRRELPRRIRRREALSGYEWALVGFGILGAAFTVIALGTSYIFWKPVFGALVRQMWHAGTAGKVLLILIAVFVLGPLVHGTIDAVRSVAGHARGWWNRLRFRTELHWRREAGAMIAELPLLQELPLSALNELAGRVQLRRVAAGQAIVRQGEAADAFYVIRRGRVAIVDETPAGDEDVVRMLTRGQAFGELALLESRPRTATVRAEIPTDLFVVDKGSFDRLLAGRLVAPTLEPTVSALAEVWSLPPFRKLSATRARAVAEAGRWLAFPASKPVIRKGAVADAFYVVAAGRLAVIDDTGDVVADLGPGDHFGEVGLLLDVPRTATVRTRTPCRLFQLDREAFNQLVASALRRRSGRELAAARALPERT